MNTKKQIRWMSIGAHPDDCEIKTGGTAVITRKKGGAVCFVSATNGNAGHHVMQKEDLKDRRSLEVKEVAETFDIEYTIMDCDDGYLSNTIENRDQLIRLIRAFKPDVIATHRPNDYHTDHRNTSLLVQDASFLLRVPLICEDVPALSYDPLILYFSDGFSLPNPFAPDIVIDISEDFDQKIRMVNMHSSQIHEWLPWLAGSPDQVPVEQEKRLQYTEKWLEQRFSSLTKDEAIKKAYRSCYTFLDGTMPKHVEAFQISEYGASVDPETFIKTWF